MATSDLEAFLRERLAIWDETLDVSAGSPVDQIVIQPILSRIGSDPFEMDITKFVQDRLAQEFPQYATKDGDALMDMLVKPYQLIHQPVVSEITRVKAMQSLKTPDLLTIEEADALGANFFFPRNTGDTAYGTARIYFAAPQTVSVTPSNYFTSRTGLVFFPDSIQQIRVEEMLLNQEGSLYYFDVSVKAEKAGDAYNIGPDELVRIANLTQSIRVTNKRRFRFGAPEETAFQYISRIDQELGERSLVTDRGIAQKVTQAFPEVSRLAVVGMGDPEMHRDVIVGGSLGPAIAAGTCVAIEDGEGHTKTRRIRCAGFSVLAPPQFLTKIGPVGAVTGWSMTLMMLGLPSALPIKDCKIIAVVDDVTVDVEDQVFDMSAVTGIWELRKQELTLSDIPGGILFPDGTTGTVSVESDRIHIGGATDVFIRGADNDTSSLLVSNVTDERPTASGVLGEFGLSSTFVLYDLVLGTNYSAETEQYDSLTRAATDRFALVVLDGAGAGVYNLLSVTQPTIAGSSPILTLRNAPSGAPPVGQTRWRLMDVLDVNLVEPKELRISGTDLRTDIGVDLVDTVSGINFQMYGVSVGDTFRLLTGPDKRDYTIKALVGASYTQLQLDAALHASLTGLSYEIFRPNASGGISLPLVRVQNVDLLDSSGQPVGTKIPYAKAIEAVSDTFANIGVGVKVDVNDASLGIIGSSFSIITISAPAAFKIRWAINESSPSGSTMSIFLTPGSYTVAEIVALMNSLSGMNVFTQVVDPGGVTSRVGMLPIRGSCAVVQGDNPLAASKTLIGEIFGSSDFERTTRDVYSARQKANGGWSLTNPFISPPVDTILDVVQILDGNQVSSRPGPIGTPDVVMVAVGYDFFPEANRHVQLGSRSLGNARVYFLEPTSVEFGAAARFTATLSGGQKLTYLPDPTNYSTRIPAPPSGTKPADGVKGPTTLTSASTDFIAKGIQVGDKIVIDYMPLIGTAALSDPHPVAGKSIVISVDGRPDQKIVLVKDSASIPDGYVTRLGIVDQINGHVGRKIAKIRADNKLEFEPTTAMTLRYSTAADNANTLLKFGISADLSNDAPYKGTYSITALDVGSPNVVTVTPTVSPVPPPAFGDGTRQQFSVIRPGVQRFSTTEMSNNISTEGLYYVDVQLVSEGTGNLYNVLDGTEMSVDGYQSDGYYLSTEDSNLSFSTVERPWMHLSRAIMPVGVNDDLENAIQLSNQNIQINYDLASIVSSVQAFCTAETERVTNESILVRHLTPYYVRFGLLYIGVAIESEAQAAVEKYITELFPSDPLESSGVQAIVRSKGATSITNPLNLVAVIHNTDRTVTVERSQDHLNTGRLAAFIPDAVTVTRKLS